MACICGRNIKLKACTKSCRICYSMMTWRIVHYINGTISFQISIDWDPQYIQNVLLVFLQFGRSLSHPGPTHSTSTMSGSITTPGVPSVHNMGGLQGGNLSSQSARWIYFIVRVVVLWQAEGSLVESEAFAAWILAGDHSIWKGQWTILKWKDLNKIISIYLKSQLKGGEVIQTSTLKLILIFSFFFFSPSKLEVSS